MTVEERELVSDNAPVMHYSCSFVTYKEDWDDVKEEFGITDEKLRDLISQALQMWAWADILQDVRSYLEDENIQSSDTTAREK